MWVHRLICCHLANGGGHLWETHLRFFFVTHGLDFEVSSRSDLRFSEDISNIETTITNCSIRRQFM